MAERIVEDSFCGSGKIKSSNEEMYRLEKELKEPN